MMSLQSKFIMNAFLSSFMFSAVVFLAAGTFHYFQGWLYCCVSFITTLMNVLSIRHSSELMNERMNTGEGVKLWDKRILGVSLLCFLTTAVLGGLDSGRYQWSPQFPLSLYVLGVLFMILGQMIFLTARYENKYFSTVVRIQHERGHQVCETGLYRLVRHPGYFGMIISTLGLPCVLGSQWSVLPVIASVVLIIVRTSLEDKTLQNELPGYTVYMQKSIYKLIPYLW